MQTLETMIQGTKIGAYAALFYGVLICIFSGVVLIAQVSGFSAQQERFAKYVSSTYTVPVTKASPENLMCFQGILHYKNVGIFSGALAYAPNIICDEDKFNEMKSDSESPVIYAVIALIVLLLGALAIISAYIDIVGKEEMRKWQL